MRTLWASPRIATRVAITLAALLVLHGCGGGETPTDVPDAGDNGALARLARDFSFATDEDVQLTADLRAGETGLESFTWTLVGAPANGVATLATDGSFTYKPGSNFTGEDSFTFQVGDGAQVSAPARVSVAVRPVNDAPRITGPVAALATVEDSALTLALGDLTVVDPDNGYPTGFTLIVEAGQDYTASGDSITPAADFNGELTVGVRVSDGTDPSERYELTVTVTPVNDAPVITGQQPLSTPEDTALTLALFDLDVSDVDSTQLTLIVGDGANYTRQGTTVTPAGDFNGELHVPVEVTDEAGGKATFEVTVAVTAVNDAPVITGQRTMSTSEETPQQLAISDLVIVDPDNSSQDFTLTIGPGANYTVAGNAITPAPEFSGTLTIPVSVSDGNTTSAVFQFALTVTPVDDAPTITAQVSLSTTEDSALTLTLGNFTIVDPDTAPTGLSLIIGSGANYTAAGATITPARDFNGALTVPVKINDGTSDSAPFAVQITVTPVNDPPEITGQLAVTTPEDTARTITLADLQVTDVDGPALTLALAGGTNYTITGDQLTPATNFNGTLTVPVTVSDGAGGSDTLDLTVAVTAVNDTPTIQSQASATIAEDGSYTLALSNLVVQDPDNSFPADFTLTVQTGSNYTVAGNVVTPARDWHGTLQVPVTVNDGTASSAPFDFTLVVTPVNDPPEITGQVAVTTPEDTARTITLADLQVADVDGPGLTLAMAPGANYSLAGDLLTPATNFSGTLTVPVTVSDGAGGSDTLELTVTVTAVNDDPVIASQAAATIAEDTSYTLALSNLVVQDPDNGPADFTLTVQPGGNYTVAGNVITPARDWNGTLHIPVTVNDGTATSAPFDFVLAVTPVDDPPMITGQVPLSTPEETPITLALANLQISNPDGPLAGTVTLVVGTGANYSRSGTTVTPAVDFTGTLTVPVMLTGGAADSAWFNVQINITPVNDAPRITGQLPLTTAEETPLTLSVANLVIEDPDSTTFTLSVGTGSQYTVAGTKVTPAKDYVGTLTVPVTVSDGTAGSNTFTVSVAVTPVNDAPIITAHTLISTPEDTPVTITLAHLMVVDPDNAYPADFTLRVLNDAGQLVPGNRVTPPADFFGPITVTVIVNDGTADSAPMSFSIDVSPVNDAPVIIAHNPVSTREDTPVTLALANLLVQDPDDTWPADFTLSVLDGAGYTRAGNTITPPADFTGGIRVRVTVNDGAATSNVFEVTVTVEPVNDAPVIAAQSPITIAEDTARTLEISDLQITDPDSTNFWVLVADGANYTRQGATITPALDFTGTLTVPVRVTDGSADSATFNLSVTVTPVNDPPVILSQAGAMTVADGAPLTLTRSHLVVTDVDNADQSAFVLKVQDGANYTRATNTITQATGFHGMLSVPVVISDGTTDSAPFNVQIAATWNWAPVAGADSFATSGNTLLESSPTRNVLSNDSDVEDGTVTISVFPTLSTNGGVVTLAANGTFTYLPPAGFTGNDTFKYTVKDSANKTTEGTVTIAVGQRIWYVRAGSDAANTGRSGDPFPTLAKAQAAATAPKDVIFVYAGDYLETITLKDEQKLIGEGAGLVRTPNTDIIPGTRPTLKGVVATAVTLARTNTVAGLNIMNAGTAIFGNKGGGASIGGVTITSSGRGIHLQSSSGVVSLSGVTVTSPTQDAIAVEASSGTLSVSATSVTGGGARGLVASGLAELAIADSGVSFAAKTAALEVANTPLVNAVLASLSSTGGTGHAHGLRLDTISSGTFRVLGDATFNGATTGIGARNTGSLAVVFDRTNLSGCGTGIDYSNATGSLTVSAGKLTKTSGGTIQNTTSGPGIKLAGVKNVSLNNLTIRNTKGDGIQIVDGNGVAGFTLQNAELNTIGTTFFQYALNLGAGSNQLTGTALVDTVTLGGLSYGGLYLDNQAGTLDLTVRALTLNGTANSGNGIVLRSSGTATTTFTLDASALSAINGSGDGVALGTAVGASRLTATVKNTTFHNPSAAGNSAIRITNDGAGSTLTATVEGNQTSFWNGTPIAVDAGDQGSMVRATIRNNIIGTMAALSGSQSGNGISVLLDADATAPASTTMDGIVSITGNTVRQVAGHGIYVVARDGLGTASANRLDATVTGNQVSGIGPLFDGISVRALDTTLVCANVASNASAMGSGGIGAYHLRQSGASAFWLQGLSGTNRTNTDAQAHLTASANTGTPVYAFGTYNAASSGLPAGTVCRTP